MQRKRCRVCKIFISHWFAVAKWAVAHQQSRVLLPLCIHCLFQWRRKRRSFSPCYFPSHLSRLGIHTWPVTTNQIVSCDSLCCSNLISCNSEVYLWLTKIVLANVRTVTKANLVRHSSSRFISLSKVFLNKVSSKKHCHAINFCWQMYWLK